ncbi:MAG: hypothetical protein RL139_567 [Gemmatimonadota bacterium]|jgi:hypothetical protein
MTPLSLRSRLRAFAALLCTLILGRSLTAQSTALPTPESVFGHTVGADFRLIDYRQSIDYFRRLAAASDRIRLLEVGRTSQGRPWTIALISSPSNLADLERLRGIAQRLAHPDGLSDAEARALARSGKVFVDISGGLHASEIAGSQHTVQLAYDLLSRDDARTRAILDATVLILWPSINPDGQEIVVQWYRKNVGTPYEVAPLDSLYQRYIGHDNNRDAYMLNQVESRVVARTWRHWEPQVIYVQHQTAPFPTRIWLPPFAEPVTPRVPGLMAREVNTIGMTIAQALETNGQVGATHMGKGFDAWYPGYIDYLPMLQNIAAFWTETALYSYATPKFYTIDDFPAEYRDLRPQSLYASPWRGGWWRLRDAVDYMETGSLATLDYAAKYREELLWNRYQAGREAIARYRKEPPYAYVIPQAQRDPGAAVALLQRLAFNGIRIATLAREADLGGQRYPAGTWVIPMDQEFAEVVRQLFDRQRYPDLRDGPEGAPEPPYDAAGWTLPYLTDVKVAEVRTPISVAVASVLTPVAGRPTGLEAPEAPFSTNAVAAGIIAPPALLTGTGPAMLVDPGQNDAFRLVNRALAAGGTVRMREGRYVVSGVATATLDGWARALGLRAAHTADLSGAPVATRLALYQPSAPSMDAGWTEWLLDRHEFRYAQIGNADLQAGELRQRFDVIVLASDRAATLRDGYVPGRVPPSIEGGIGDEGSRALDAFVRAGGTVVAMNAAAAFAIDALHLPVRNVVRGLGSAQFFASGSILEVAADTTHPVMAGMPERAKVFFDQSPVFAPGEGFVGATLARYAAAGSPLLSGYLLGESHLQGAAGALDVAHGRGHVILLGFRPQWRGQTIGTFRVLLNAALYAPAPVRRPSSE